MNIDFTLKYRPNFFSDFWHQEGVVESIISFFRCNLIPKSIILLGDYGTGKTSLARVIGKATSCEKTDTHEPCNICYGCNYWDTICMSCTGSTAIIQGNDFDRDSFKQIMYEVSHFMPKEPYNAYIIIIDEAHRLSLKEQEIMLDKIEDSKHSHFIFCTTRLDKISDGIRKRSHEFILPLPNIEEALSHLRKIANKEKIMIEDKELYSLIRASQYTPRACLQALQRYKVLGNQNMKKMIQY